MAEYTHFDPRVDSLVMETRTLWDSQLADLSPADQSRIAQVMHRSPSLAASVRYERTHTGFIRIITVQPEDVERVENHVPERIAGRLEEAGAVAAL